MILSTLDIKNIKKKKNIFLILSIVCLAIGIIYETFSHNVYSAFMLGAWAIPLIMGVILPMILLKLKLKMPTYLENELWNLSIATLTFGSFFNGFLEIYGTTNQKIFIYWLVGGTFFVISFLKYLIRKV